MKAAVNRHKDSKIHHVMILIGDDFTFTDAKSSFEWIDTLIT